MPKVTLEAQLSVSDLLQAIEQLSLPELEELTSRAIALKAQRRAPSLSKEEGALLLEINKGIEPEIQERYEELTAKREALTLTPEEYEELLRLSDRVEVVEAKRLELLTELAQLRQTSLAALLQELEIETSPHV